MFTEVLDTQRLVGVARRGADRVLRSQAVAVATAPHGVDRYLEQVRPTWVGGDEVRARVVAVRREAPEVATLTLRPGRGWTGAEAGQHVQVGVELDGRRRTRSFSLASSAHRGDGCVEITVKAHAGGVVSRHPVDQADTGLTVALSASAGDFTLPRRRPDRLLFISGGSGITPVMAMLRTLCDEGHDQPVTFLHYARTEAEVIFAAELSDIARAFPTVDVRIALTGGSEAAVAVDPVLTGAPQPGRSAAGDRPSGVLHGRFCADHLAALGSDLDDVEAYASGPVGMVDTVLDHWEAAGATERLHVERFALVPTAPSADDIGVEVRFTATGTTVANDGQPLLIQAEAAGLSPAHGCRMGICHTCTRRKANGVVRDLRTGALSSADDEPIQICVSVPVSDIAVDL